MKRWIAVFLCGMLALSLCACGRDHREPASTPITTTEADSTTATTTTGALVVTDASGSAVTKPDGTPATTIVTGLPTKTQAVTKPGGETQTKPDGTVETEAVVPPYITVSTDAAGTTYTSLVPSQTVTTATTATTTTGALVVTDASGSAVTKPDGNPATTIVTGLPTQTQPVTKPGGETQTKPDGTVETEVVVPPYITVSTDAAGTTHTSLVPSQTVTTATTTTTTSTTTTTATTVTTTTTAPPAEQTINGIVLPASGHIADRRIKIGQVSLNGNEVSIVVRNTSSIWQSEDSKSYFKYVCYDKDDKPLESGKISFGYIPVLSEKTCKLTLPAGTAKLKLTDFKAEYWSKPVL